MELTKKQFDVLAALALASEKLTQRPGFRSEQLTKALRNLARQVMFRTAK